MADSLSISETSSPTTVASLLRAIGGWTHPSGRGLFMFRMMTSNMAAASFCGVACAYGTSAFLGPVAAIGFAIGSCIGFVASTYYFWVTAQRSALAAFDNYPQIMMLHLMRNYRTHGFEKMRMENEEEKIAFRGRLGRELQLRCLLMSAHQSAEGAIDEIIHRKEAQLISQISGS